MARPAWCEGQVGKGPSAATVITDTLRGLAALFRENYCFL